MSNHPYDKLQLTDGSNFIFTPCPGTKGVPLSDSVQQLKLAGAEAILTLMYDSELKKYSADVLEDVCRDYGVQWFQLPISDEDAPNEDFSTAFKKHLSEIIALIKAGGTIAVHCKGGSGRTGLVIGLIMLHLNYDKEEIVRLVQSIRPKALNHPVQRDFFDSFQRIEIG